MKAILEFNLPEEAAVHLKAVHAETIYGVIEDARNQMRAWLKYGHEFKSPDEAIESCRGLLNGVDIEL